MDFMIQKKEGDVRTAKGHLEAITKKMKETKSR
jgi:hypothetical protein